LGQNTLSIQSGNHFPGVEAMFKQRSSGKKQDLNPEISDKASHFSIHEMGG
jgi:hypothetical protein